MAVPHVDRLCGPNTEDTEETSEEEMAQREADYQRALGSRPPLPREITSDPSLRWAVELVCACTARDPDDRPSALDVVHTLEKGLLLPEAAATSCEGDH